MSKLFKLKQWVTITQAASHLSGIFEEEVTEADVLQLGLNGNLKISVNFNIPVYARIGIRKRLCDGAAIKASDYYKIADPLAQFTEVPQALINQGIIPQGHFFTGIRVAEDEIVDFDKEIIVVHGVWDLLNWGGEKLLVRKLLYKALSEGKELNLADDDGAYVQSCDGKIVLSLQKHFAEFGSFYPMDLPESSFLVIRTESLSEFEHSLRDQEKTLIRTPHDALVQALGLMALLLADTSPKLKNGKKPNYSQIKEQIKLKAHEVFKLKDGEIYPNLENINRDLKVAVEALEAQAPKH